MHSTFVSHVRGDQVSSTVIRARTSKMALEREREREAGENERREEKESGARDRPIHEEDEGISYVRVKLVWKDVTRVHACTNACMLVDDDWYTLEIPLAREEYPLRILL